MHVLICDDDASTRFVIKRLLTQHLGCTSTECVDGADALRRLDEEDVDLVVLDVEMPVIDGVEVLEALRSSQRLKSLPVLMLSKERREDVVLRLVKLGIEGYVLKPPRTEKVLAALERLRGRLSKRTKTSRANSAQAVRLGPDAPALLVDGNLDYRHFFLTEGTKQGPIMEAGSGAAALAHFRHAPTPLVFVGTDLGVLGADLLIPKLRAMASGQPLRIVGIVDPTNPADANGAHFDDVMIRTYVPERFKSELQRFTRIPGPLAAVTALAGDLSQGVTSAARQVFGMMLDSEVEPLDSPVEAEPMIAAISDITIQNRFSLKLGIRSTVPNMTAIAARMLGMESADVGIEDYLSTCAELANLISGRLHAHLDEKQVTSDCSLPQVEREPAVWKPESLGDNGVAIRFRITGVDATITMSAAVSDREGDRAGDAAALAQAAR